jgi:hypothetical protein
VFAMQPAIPDQMNTGHPLVNASANQATSQHLKVQAASLAETMMSRRQRLCPVRHRDLSPDLSQDRAQLTKRKTTDVTRVRTSTEPPRAAASANQVTGALAAIAWLTATNRRASQVRMSTEPQAVAVSAAMVMSVSVAAAWRRTGTAQQTSTTRTGCAVALTKNGHDHGRNQNAADRRSIEPQTERACAVKAISRSRVTALRRAQTVRTDQSQDRNQSAADLRSIEPRMARARAARAISRSRAIAWRRVPIVRSQDQNARFHKIVQHRNASAPTAMRVFIRSAR